MKLVIKHKNYQISLILKDKKEVKGAFDFSAGEDLSRNFLELLDKFLKKCNTSIVSVEKIELKEGKNIGLTSSRIVKTIVQTIDLSLNNFRHEIPRF